MPFQKLREILLDILVPTPNAPLIYPITSSQIIAINTIDIILPQKHDYLPPFFLRGMENVE